MLAHQTGYGLEGGKGQQTHRPICAAQSKHGRGQEGGAGVGLAGLEGCVRHERGVSGCFGCVGWLNMWSEFTTSLSTEAIYMFLTYHLLY